MNLACYRFLTRLLSLPIFLYLLWRLKKGKEDRERFRERLGYASLIRPEGIVIWVHAVSVGESVSVLPLIDRLIKRYPHIHVLLTTGTVTSAKLIAGKLPENCLHQYVPVDSYSAVKRFVHYWRPNLALWVESELWPNLVTQAADCCPVIMVNGHLSEKTFAFWRRYPLLRKTLMQSFTRCLTQSKEDKERLLHMGAAHVEHLGNLKYDAPPLPASALSVEAMAAFLEGRVVWLAASTHEGEEEMAAEAHLKLKSSYPSLLTVIVPRHPVRAPVIALELAKKGLTIALRSKEEPITPHTDIYIADTMGELGVFFRTIKSVFIGASLVARGGHNPLEPARLGCAIIMGPFGYNCADICRNLQEQGALIIVKDGEGLYSTLESLLGHTAQQDDMAIRALKVVQDTNNISEKYMAAIEPFIRRE